MKRYWKLCFVVGICVLNTPLFGAQIQKNLKSLKADFEQIIITEDGAEASYFGTLEAKAPNKAKWVYEPPMQKEVYVNEGKISVYEPPLKQVHISTLTTQSDVFEILEKATPEVDSAGKPTGRYTTTLNETLYTITFSTKGLLQEISYRDSLQQTTRIIFSRHTLNPKIADLVFVFTPPKDVDVIVAK
ncbi:LolA-like outer membrane lipoprotein chaperone [uncultured Helicobacter sp.]|uniref:LolA-like outer membrane lipoprotein chaperone n=1 Tax=uncultured Helicobacter sp. TaxID=175537 RepID=UPI001C39D171|nr:LolA-like outer membrane lipoprotein chaperone [Candidatus Helicobacter avicola]